MPEDAIARLDGFAPGGGRLAPRALLDTSAEVRALDGRWRFRLLPTAADTSDGFAAPAFDDAAWDTIPVPSSWQIVGLRDDDGALLPLAEARFGRPAYTNITYPFPIDPPHPPDANPTGEYRVAFEHGGAEDGRWLLRFEGVDSHFTVWLNGVELGWGTGSRLPTEFDATPHLRSGRNVLAVRVHQWSAASYLEDQDMWWLSGIFRSVTLRHRPEQGIDDLFAHAAFDATDGSGVLRVDGPEGARVTIADLGLVAATNEDVRIPDVRAWTAEAPHRYRVEVATASEVATLHVGFRSVSTEGGVLTVNGSPIRLRGVNRHEWHPDTGRTLDEATMRHDVELMKQHHINAVRTSHYPPDPRFLDLCDELGLWVIDECDLETHGFGEIGWADVPTDDPRWREALLDRAERMVERDKNHPSVILWSLGNESWSGSNLVAMTDWIRARDPERPIHYAEDLDGSYADVVSRMYPDLEDLRAWGRREEPSALEASHDARRRALPMLICEYGHAMGNGPGGLQEYEELFDAFPRLAGGFVWEWLDHGIRQLRDTGPNRGEEFFAYGGDFGEPVHDGNFVADGLVLPDRTPSPGLHEYAAVIAPIRMTIGEGDVRIENRHDFLDLAGFAFGWVVEEEGVPVASGALEVPAIGPRASAVIPLPSEALTASAPGTWLRVEATTRAAAPVVPAGHRVGVAERRLTATVSHESGEMTPVRSTGAGWQVGPATFDARGDLRALHGIAIDGLALDLWRAPTDNDGNGHRGQASRWNAARFDRPWTRVVEVREEGDALVVDARVGFTGLDAGFTTRSTWTADGSIVALELVAEPFGRFRTGMDAEAWGFARSAPLTIPRLGLRLHADLPADATVDWIGLGPGEAYADTRAAGLHGLHRSTVAALQTPYLKPQENGRRADVERIAIRSDSTGLRIRSAEPIGVAVRPWSVEQLTDATHDVDLHPEGGLWLHLDVAQYGIGSAACGPDAFERYRLRPRPFRMRLRFEAVEGAGPGA